ncbi:hypothetical protein [Streptomyces sp. NPDC050287]
MRVGGEVPVVLVVLPGAGGLAVLVVPVMQWCGAGAEARVVG